MPAAGRTIVVGDVHGCIEELEELVTKVGYRRGADRLVLAGDLMDRGPDPVGVVRRARELGAEGVLGNHDEKHLRWRRHEARRRSDPGYVNPMPRLGDEVRRQNEALSADDVAWLEQLPLWLEVGDRFLAVHGGFLPLQPFHEQDARIVIRLRRIDASGKMVPLRAGGFADPGAVDWATRWPGPESVVYGHHVHGLAEPRIDEPAPGVRCFGIDTGCCYGGRLTALVLPAAEVVQVQARHRYATHTP